MITLDQLFRVQRKINAEAAFRLHDSMPRNWRDLANEYGDVVAELYHGGVHIAVAQPMLEAQLSRPTYLS